MFIYTIQDVFAIALLSLLLLIFAILGLIIVITGFLEKRRINKIEKKNNINNK